MFTQGYEAPTEADFEQMYSEFLATYKGDETRKMSNMGSFEVFKSTVNEIITHNQDETKTWKKGMNQYTDWTHEEFMDFFGLRDGQECSATASPKKAYNADFPEFFDWTDFDKVTPVKNQGKCGSCWTFSTVGAMEAHALLSHDTTPSPKFNFSEQQLVDCAFEFDNNGCSGGLPSHAFEYIKLRGGLEHRETYEYNAVDQDCTHNSANSVVTTSGSFNITEGDEVELHEALAFEGPVSVSYQVRPGFKEYESGVYSNDECGQTTMDVNHAVLAVGYGNEDGVDYYRIKNSWGADWGAHGFFKIRAYTNECAIGVCNSYPENVRLISKNPLNSVKDFLASA